jgi:hypothetical protein
LRVVPKIEGDGGQKDSLVMESIDGDVILPIKNGCPFIIFSLDIFLASMLEREVSSPYYEFLADSKDFSIEFISFSICSCSS